MADDAKVTIGVEIVSDIAGADQAAEAVRKVGEAAQEAQQATAQGIGTDAFTKEFTQETADAMANLREELRAIGQTKADVAPVADELGGLVDEVSNLGNTDKARAISGLRQVLASLGSGDLQTQVSGLARGLSNLVQSLPLPGVAVGVSAAVAVLAGIYRAFGDEIFGAKEEVNEFGETVDEEMERLGAWANEKLSWKNITDANKQLIESFKTVETIAKTARDAIEKLYAVRGEGKVAALEKEAAAATAAGKPEEAAAIQQKIADEKSLQELVGLNVKQAEAQIALAEMIEELRAAQKARDDELKESQARKQKLEEIRAKIQEMTGSLAATKQDSEAFKALLKQVEETAAKVPIEEAMAAQQRGFGAGPFPTLEETTKTIEGARQLAEDLKNLADIEKQAAESSDKYRDAQAKWQEKQKTTVANIAAATSELAVINEQIKQATQGASPEIIRQSQETAARQIQAINDVIASAAEAAGGGFTILANAGIEGGRKIAQAAGDSGAAINAAMQDIVGPIEQIGPAVLRISGTTAAANASLKTAIAELGSAGEGVKESAGKFRVQLGAAAAGFQTAAEGFGNAAQSIGAMGQQIGQNQVDIARTVAALSRDVQAALQQSGLALSQIRNQQ